MGVRFSGPLVGRHAELGRLDAALARTSRGASAVVLVGSLGRGQLRKVAGRARSYGVAPEAETVALAALGEAEATRLEGRSRPAQSGGRRARR